MSNAIFHLGLLKNYQIVNVPGVYKVAVAYTINPDNIILDDYPRYLVPLKVLNAKSLTTLVTVLTDETKVVPFDAVKNYFMTGVLWESDVDIEDLPLKGERVLATFDNKDNKLMCTNIELMPRTELEYVDIDNLLEFRKTIFNLMNLKD